MSELIANEPHGELALYEAAVIAISEAKSVDEVKFIRDRHDAMRAAARIAKNKSLEVDAAEIRIRAERRLGEMMAEQKETVGMATGTKGQLKGKDSSGGFVSDPPEDRPITLSEAGIDKSLADRARKYAAVPEDEFEEELGDWRERVSQEGKRVTTRLERRGEDAIKVNRVETCSIPDTAIVSTCLTCPTCGQEWPEGRSIHG